MPQPPTSQPVWYIRKSGWVQGPFTSSMLRQMYATAWIGSMDNVSNEPAGPWRKVRDFPELSDQPCAASPQPSDAIGWEIASPTFRGAEPVEIGMLQMFAAAGRLRPNDLVRRVPDGEWQPARRVEGIFGGRRTWCTACNAALGGNRRICRACGAAQPDYEPTLAMVAVVCGVVAFTWTLVAFGAVTALAARQATVFGVAMDQSFPRAYVLTLVAPLWLAVAAAVLGNQSVSAVRAGRSSPIDGGPASAGMLFGWSTLGLLLLIVVGVTAFSLPYFRLVT